ncbi:MAG TPA: hypothetical protein VF219_12955 [Vicinamibacterales bacterium]
MNRKLVLIALATAMVAAPMFAASYVVPPDDVFIDKSDTIVIARAITSYSVAESDGNIVTVTEFALGQTVKGFAQPTIQLRIPGGVVDGRVKMVSGAPVFTAGLDYLLFLRNLPNGGVAPTDFGLGVFAFNDHLGRPVVERSAEAFGWDLDGKEHLERKRDAAAFLRYVRSVVAHRSGSVDYLLSVPATATEEGMFRPTIMSTSFTGTSYTVSCDGSGDGCTWAGFPVNFNQGSSESGAPGTPPGKSAITTAFGSWNGAGVGINYVYATNNANSNGILDAPDHVNNIVFDKDLSGAGAPAYSCAGGGVLGIGGISSASGTHMHNGETYANNSEVDVSMNKGIANCTSLFSSGDFDTAVTHEVGHTLGLRHSDQTRTDNPNVACSTDPTLDCATTAVMHSFIPHNISGALQTWDLCAVTSIYGSGSAAPSITVQPAGSTITSGNQASLSVTATSPAGVAQTYQWYVGTTGTTATPVAGGTTSSIMVSPTSTTQYWVRITGCGSTDSNAATVTVNGGSCTAPAITTQPVGSTITQGNSAGMSVSATGTATLTYQWYIGNKSDTSNPIGGQTASSITVSPSSTTSYWARVTNSCGHDDSNAATITVNPVSCTAPQITTQPTGSTITFGNTAQLSVAASGSATLSYQWYTSPQGNTSSPVFNGNTATIVVSPQGTTTYWARATNSCGTADSNTATVTVNCQAPQVTVTPSNRTITQGSSTIFSAIATGGPNMTFQWYQGIAPDTSNPLAGQTGSALTISPAASTSYWVQATVPSCGPPANSNTVTVTVTPNNGCPSVTITTPTATQNGASYTLATTASTGNGGGTVTITWYQQTNSGLTAIGTGPSITVSPTVTTTYLAQATNACNSSNSATVTVTIGPSCTAPTVTQPGNQTIGLGTSTTITVTASGSGTLHYQWYKGAGGNTSVPVGTDSATLITGSLTANSSFWVKVTNDCSSSTNSATVTISVEPARRRSVHHH